MGTIELENAGRERAYNPLDYITKEAGTYLAPKDTPHPIWTAFLNRVNDNNDALIAFLQRFLGYCLTGYVHEHVLVFLFGTGANGKTVFIETVAGVFGDYAITAPMEMFLNAKFDRHPTEIARLKGARLVIAQETTRGRSWDEAKIKNLTGGGTLTGRFMRGDFFDFKPSHKLLIAGNTKPSLRNVDEAMRRRILLVPFTVCIPEAERDRKLAEKLKPEWPAILRWMLDGCLEWQRFGLVVPTIVRDASTAYFTEQDVVEQWLDAECVRDAQAFTSSKAYFESWSAFAQAAGEFVGSQRALTEYLIDKGFRSGTQRVGDGKPARGLVGFRLRGERDELAADAFAADPPDPVTYVSIADAPCAECGVNDGKVYLARYNLPTSVPLHQGACAARWFSLEP